MFPYGYHGDDVMVELIPGRTSGGDEVRVGFGNVDFTFGHDAVEGAYLKCSYGQPDMLQYRKARALAQREFNR